LWCDRRRARNAKLLKNSRGLTPGKPIIHTAVGEGVKGGGTGIIARFKAAVDDGRRRWQALCKQGFRSQSDKIK